MIDEDDCGAIGGMKIVRRNRSTRRKPAPAPFCPPQIPHDQTRARTPGRRGGKLATNRLSYGATRDDIFLHDCKNIVTHLSEYPRVLNWKLDLLTTLTHDSRLHLIIAPTLMSTIYKLLQDSLNLFSLLCFH
jgi:hypothetical protein